jgi:hypothetical protein
MSIEELNKKTNNELLAIINEYADKAESYRLKSMEYLTKLDEAEGLYIKALNCLNSRVNPSND